MMENVELKEVAGYLSEKAVWQIIKDLASGSQPDVWEIGATAFYALMGVEPFPGSGREGQTAEEYVPRVGAAHCSRHLSDTIYHCLAFNAEERHTPQELVRLADEALRLKTEPPKRLSTLTGKRYDKSIVHFWPEEMSTVIVLFLMLLLPYSVFSQTKPTLTAEMEKLVNLCCDLRDPANAAKVERALYDDRQWTLMDEIAIDKKGECTIYDDVNTLGLNQMGYKIARYNRGVSNTGGRFRDGRDPRYYYSLIEVTAKRGASISYDITGRKGTQLFAVVPCAKGATFDVTLTCNGELLGREYDADGVKYIAIDDAVKATDMMKLCIENKSRKNQSFVIINYNSRR